MPECRMKLAQDKADATEAFPLGEQAHIVGEKTAAARGTSALSDAERDGYPNRILLCPNHHTTIDNDEAGWPVERLHAVKTEHELWVEEHLTTERTVRAEADDLTYATLMDRAVDLVRLDAWEIWASKSLEPMWTMPRAVVDGIAKFRQIVFVTDWPGRYSELELALDRLSFELQEAAVSFAGRATHDGDYLKVERDYKKTWHKDPRVYQQLSDEFYDWSHEYERRIFEATKAANWAREVWRREVNPMFRATEGLFHLELWPDDSLRWRWVKLAYSEEEKAEIVRHGLDAKDIRPPQPRERD